MKTDLLPQQTSTPSPVSTMWLAAILAFAAIKVLLGLVGFFGGIKPELLSPTPFPEGIFVLNMVVFAGSSGGLLIGGYRDRRAVYLAGVFCCIASSFAKRFIQASTLFLSYPFQLPIGLLALDASAFLPLF